MLFKVSLVAPETDPELNACIRKQIEELKEASRQINPDGTMTDGKG